MKHFAHIPFIRVADALTAAAVLRAVPNRTS